MTEPLIFGRELWWAIRPEIMPLWKLHNAEIASPGDQGLFDPDWQKFDDTARADKDHWITARRGGELVGYVFAIVDTHMHRRGTLSAFYDLYWLKPSCRRGLAGYRLLAEAERTLWERGVRKQYLGTKAWKDMSRIFERMGWTETERLFTKSLD